MCLAARSAPACGSGCADPKHLADADTAPGAPRSGVVSLGTSTLPRRQDSIPVILLIHRSNCLARLGWPCQLVDVAGNAANRKRDASSQPLPPRMKRRRFARTEAATEAIGRVFKEEARSARKAKAGRGPNPLSSSARHGTEAFGRRKRGGTGAFGQGNRIAAPDAFGRKGKRRNRPRPKGLGRNRSGRWRCPGGASGRKSGGWWQHRPPFAFGAGQLPLRAVRAARKARAEALKPAWPEGLTQPP